MTSEWSILILMFLGKDQGHRNIEGQTIVRLITWEDTDQWSTNLVWRLVISSG